MISKLLIRNFKKWKRLDLPLNNDVNILVGDNDTGKSTILQAIEMVLTGKVGGRAIEQEIAPHWFSQQCVRAYLDAAKTDPGAPLPEIVVEAYFQDSPDVATLVGRNNVLGERSSGFQLLITFDPDYAPELQEILASDLELVSLPVEYYKVERRDFSGERAPLRNQPVKTAMIDTSGVRLYSGVDYYLRHIISANLSDKERAGLALSYRTYRENLSKSDAVSAANGVLSESDNTLRKRTVTLGLDTSARASWETDVIPHFDQIPFHAVGQGEQSAFKMLLALDKHAKDKQVVLVEEPENHLSFGNLNELLKRIQKRGKNQQLILTTHSSLVLNKLGLDKLTLLADGSHTRFNDLSDETRDHFLKLAGYDTLRLLLARATILVEGPSDELIVQKAYEQRFGHPPIDDGIDIISVQLTFKRFLELGEKLGRKIAVITDLDSDTDQEKARRRFQDFEKADGNVRGFVGAVENGRTLEPQLVAAAGLTCLNTVLGTSFTNNQAMIDYMTVSKTDSALALLLTSEPVAFPTFIHAAIDHVR